MATDTLACRGFSLSGLSVSNEVPDTWGGVVVEAATSSLLGDATALPVYQYLRRAGLQGAKGLRR